MPRNGVSIMASVKSWWLRLSFKQQLWIILSTFAVFFLGELSCDTWVNILIGTVGMFYVSVYSTGTRGAFLLGVVYVIAYTVICLENRIVLDALQNIVLIPIYIISYIYWGQRKVIPKNLRPSTAGIILGSAGFIWLALWMLSVTLHGNYSWLDSLNTTCTLYAMVLGMLGYSLNWALWTVNNVASAIVFGLALATPTGSITVFVMKCIFLVNGLIGWRNFRKMGGAVDVH